MNECVHVNNEGNVSEEMEDEALRKTKRKKKARLRTRGPYRKAKVEIQHD